jgi:hypothetical protein
MFGGNLPDNDPFTLSLLTNKNVLNVLKYSKNNRQLFNTNNQVAWAADDTKTSDKYLAVFNIADQETADETKAIWNSGVINRKTPFQSTNVDVDITNARKLFLVVTDAGDGIDWDHADWISPTIYNGNDSILVTSLPWVNATSGWERPRRDTGVSGGKLLVNGKDYKSGIGTHSNSVIEFDLPAGYTRFKATAGLDNAGFIQNTGGTVKFMIFTQNPEGAAPADSAVINISLKELGISNAQITDLWTGENAGTFSNAFSPVIRRHASGFYRISKTSINHNQ